MVSNALPLYKKIGGTFLVKNVKRWIQFKRYLRGGNAHNNIRTFLNTPPVTTADISSPLDLDGIIISLSTALLRCTNPNSRTVFLGHGGGDKPYPGKKACEELETFDFHFITGPKHLEKLKDTGVDLPEERLIRIGNMRFDDYLNGKIDKESVYSNLGIKDIARKNVLYAPTWKWGDGTLLKYGYEFGCTLSKEFNVIIRPHGHDRMHIPNMKRWFKKQNIDHVYFSNPSDVLKHDTMDDFLVSDIMISDTSSILYEYLVTQKPIIHIKTDYKNMHNMPAHLDICSVATQFDESKKIDELVKDTLEIQDNKLGAYEEMLNNVFFFNDGKSTDRAISFFDKR